MKTLYFDCGMGAAGDMLTAALLELLPDPEAFLAEFRALGIPGVEIRREAMSKCGIGGTHVTVTIDGDEESEGAQYHGHHKHTDIGEIMRFIESVPLPEKVRHDAAEVYKIIAGAESSVHGCAVENVHFHEVGSIDAMADVLNVCMLMHLLAPEKVYASSINVGGGTVKCAHGMLPVPAPATEFILRGIPTYSGEIKSELCTPTGAALLKYFVDEFGEAPVMTVSMAGYGTGKKDFAVLNAVRAMLGETERQHDEVLELSCNIDDMTAEELGFAMERLFEAGALDVWFTAIGMKKCRPGTMLSCLCRREQRDDILRCIFKNTTTLGVREHVCTRHVLSRAAAQQDSGIGTVGIKRASGWGVSRQKAEYDDLVKIAKETGMSLMEIKKLINN